MATTQGYAPVNGLKMCCEIRGKGKPLILLHGGAGTTHFTISSSPAMVSLVKAFFEESASVVG